MLYGNYTAAGQVVCTFAGRPLLMKVVLAMSHNMFSRSDSHCAADASSSKSNCWLVPNIHHKWSRAGEGAELCAAEGAVLCWQPRHGHCWTKGQLCHNHCCSNFIPQMLLPAFNLMQSKRLVEVRVISSFEHHSKAMVNTHSLSPQLASPHDGATEACHSLPCSLNFSSEACQAKQTYMDLI